MQPLGTLWQSIYHFAGWVGTNTATIAIVLTLIFTAEQARQAANAFRASTVSQIATNSQTLQWRVLENDDLRGMLVGVDTPDAGQLQAVAAGFVINNFATMFDLHELGGIPDDSWNAFKKDMKDTMESKLFRNQWEKLKCSQGPKFVKFVTQDLGIRPNPNQTESCDRE